MCLVPSDEKNTKSSVGTDHVSLFILLQQDYSLLLVLVMMSVYATRAYWEMKVLPHSFLNCATRYEFSASCSGRFTLGERADSTCRITSLVGPSASFDFREK